MKYLVSLVFIFLLSLPLGAAADITHRENNIVPEPFHPRAPPEISAAPWWERSALDENGDGISDVLEPYAALSREDSIPMDVTISFSRDLLDSDIMMLEERGFDVVELIGMIDAVLLDSVPSCRIYELMNIPDVVFIEPVGVPIQFSDIANPTVSAKQSDLYSPRTAWDLGYQGRGVSIAIIDTGIDDEHPSLKGKFLGGVDMTKPDNMHFLFPQDGTYNPDDIQGHGSTCSGIATGTGAPEGKYQGTAPEARLVDVRIGTKIGYAPGEFWAGVVSDPNMKDGTIRGIRWATNNLDTEWANVGSDYRGIDIFSLSWGVDIGHASDGTDQYSRMLDAAVDAGAIVVNAAGNDGPGNQGFTALSASSKAIIVAATDDRNTLEHDDDVVAWYSSRGPRDDNDDGDPYNELKPDIAAPGTNITQLEPDTTRITGDASNNGYGNRGSGTSYATPLVAGVIALMLEANPDLEDHNEVVKEILKYTADRKKPPTYPDLDPFWERDFGYGVVDAYAACRLAEETDVNSVDPRLQAHITGLDTVDSNFTKPYYNYTVNSTFTISGLGWSRGGPFERTEMSIDGKVWKPIPTQTNGTFNPWSIRIENLGKGEHMIRVRSVAGNSRSLLSWVNITVKSSSGPGGSMVGGGLVVPLLLVIAAALAAGIIIYQRTRVSAHPSRERNCSG